MAQFWSSASGRCLSVAAASILAIGPALALYLLEPLTIRDGGARWHESSAWGGGAATTLDLPDGNRASRTRFDFLGGAAPQLVVGCTSPTAAGGHWRIRFGFTPPGSAIGKVPGAEQAYEEGTKDILELGGTAILIDGLGAITHRLPIRRMNSGLETGPLDPRLLKAVVDATAIRIETPRVRIEAGTALLPAVFATLRQRGSPCGVVP